MSYFYTGPAVRGINVRRASANWTDKKVVPALEEYIAYGQTLPPCGKRVFNPYRMRRIVIMMRNGESFASACALLGARIKKPVFDRMPENLK